jgi:hypothetical protein
MPHLKRVNLNLGQQLLPKLRRLDPALPGALIGSRLVEGEPIRRSEPQGRPVFGQGLVALTDKIINK